MKNDGSEDGEDRASRGVTCMGPRLPKPLAPTKPTSHRGAISWPPALMCGQAYFKSLMLLTNPILNDVCERDDWPAWGLRSHDRFRSGMAHMVAVQKRSHIVGPKAETKITSEVQIFLR